MNARIRYLLKSACKWAGRKDLACPSCGCDGNSLVSRKRLVTSLRRCRHCALLYRAPTSTRAESEMYYQTDYRQGFTTDMPDAAELERWKRESFRRTPKDFSRFVALLRALGVKNGARLLDFGCSWGYGTWQFAQAGWDVEGFDVSAPRAAFAQSAMGLRVVSNIGDLGQTPYDAVFSSHVLEHLPDLRATLDTLMARLRPGGLFIAVTPNGSLAYRACRPRAWQNAWGLKHPNHMDEFFYAHAFGDIPHFIGSTPFPLADLTDWASTPCIRRGDLTGPELLAVAQPKGASA